MSAPRSAARDGCSGHHRARDVFSVGMAPASSTPATAASVIRATSSGGCPNERMPMMALSGLVLQLARVRRWRGGPPTAPPRRSRDTSPGLVPDRAGTEGHVARPWAQAWVHHLPGTLLVRPQQDRDAQPRPGWKPWIPAVIAAAATGSGRLSLERYEPPRSSVEERLGWWMFSASKARRKSARPSPPASSGRVCGSHPWSSPSP